MTSSLSRKAHFLSSYELMLFKFLDHAGTTLILSFYCIYQVNVIQERIWTASAPTASLCIDEPVFSRHARFALRQSR